MPSSLSTSLNQRALAKQNRLVNIKSIEDLDEALRTPGTPAYQKFWQWVWERRLNHATIVQYIILHLMQQASATEAERRQFLQAYWQQYSAQALKDHHQWDDPPSKQQQQIERVTEENISAVIIALQTALPLWNEFRDKISARLIVLKEDEIKITSEWQTLQAENRDALLKENSGKTILRFGEDGKFHEVVLDSAEPVNSINEFLQASEVKLMDEKLVKALSISYDFDVKKPELTPLPINPLLEGQEALPKRKDKLVKITDVMKHGNVLAELRANAACLKHDFEQPVKLALKESNSSVDLSHALLRVTNHNRKIFKTNELVKAGRKTEWEEKGQAALAGRKNRELDLLTRHLEMQLCKIECENARIKADSAIERMETFLAQLNDSKNQFEPRNKR